MNNYFKNKVRYTFLIPLFIFGCKSCQKDPDPCKELKPVTAGFVMYESPLGYSGDLWTGKSYRYSDTVVSKFVTFEADISDAIEYKWSVGAGVYTTKTFGLSFGPNDPREIPVTLIVSKSPNLNCFPDDDGKDTLTKKLAIWEKGSLVNGKFLGTWENSTQQFVMGIQCPRIEIDDIGNNHYFFVVNNYNGLGDSTGFDDFDYYDYRYNMAVFNNHSFNLSSLGYDGVFIQGTATMLSHDQIVVAYSYSLEKGNNTATAPRINRKFIGTRIK